MNISKSVKLLSGLTLAAALTVSTALADSATVTAEKSANIRDKASMSGKVIGWAMHGDQLETLGTAGNWTKVALKGGKEGYIYTALLSSGASSAPSVQGTAKVTAEISANIRDKASMSGKVIGWAMKDETVSILEKDGKWSKVQLESGLTGYIHNSLLNGKASAPSVQSTAKVTAEVSANIRDTASMSGKVIGWAMKDETVSVLEKGGKWSKVQLENGLTGYIHNSLLK